MSLDKSIEKGIEAQVKRAVESDVLPRCLNAASEYLASQGWAVNTIRVDRVESGGNAWQDSPTGNPHESYEFVLRFTGRRR